MTKEMLGILRNFIVIIAIIVLSISYLFSQGGSTLSIYGIGDIIHNSSAFYDALGTTAIAVPTDNSINLYNPALWGKLSQTRIRAGYRFNQNRIESEGRVNWQNNGKVHSILYALSIDTSKGASICFGFNSYSTVNYLISKSIRVVIDGYELNGEDLYQGSGGISQALLGASFKPLPFLYVGASIFADLGTINRTTKTLVYGSYASSAYNEITDHFAGMGFRAGILAEPVRKFLIGGFFETHNKTNLTSNQHYIYELTLDTTFTTESKIQLPSAYGIGISFTTDRLMFAADFSSQNFSTLQYNLGQRASFGNEYKLSLGISRIRNKSSFVSFGERITYNWGAYYKNLYTRVDGKSISEYAGTFGFEIPIVGSTFFNAGFVLGARVPSADYLPKEYFGRMILEISLGETWFVPFRRE